jgi:hypothetical protein
MEQNGTTDEHLITCLPECSSFVLKILPKTDMILFGFEGKSKEYWQ